MNDPAELDPDALKVALNSVDTLLKFRAYTPSRLLVMLLGKIRDDLRGSLGMDTFPEVDVVVTPHDEGAEIRVSVDGDRDRRFKIDDDDLGSPIVRLLVGAAIT